MKPPYKAYPHKTLGKKSLALYWIAPNERKEFLPWNAHTVRVFGFLYIGSVLHYWVKICDNLGEIQDEILRLAPWTQVSYARRYKK